MDIMATPFEHRVLNLQSIRLFFFNEKYTKQIAEDISNIRKQAKKNYEQKLRSGNDSNMNYELFKIKLIDAILVQRDVAKATHWYSKWDEAVNEYYEDMTIHPEKFAICSVSGKTGKINGLLENSGMLDSCGKIFAEEKNLFQFLITVI